MNRHLCLFRNSARTLFLVFLSVIAEIPALAQDTTPPVLAGFTFSPTAVNTTTNPATVSVTAQITDDLSGVREAYLGFNSPSGSQNVTVFLSLSSGTDLNGTWTGIGTFPVGSETGTWVVGVVVLYDNVGNNQEYSTSDLQALGFPTTLQVTSIQDTTPPVLTGFTFSPTAVNTTTNPATVSVTAQITDDLSGVREAYLGFNSPSGSQNVTVFLSLSSGTDLNGTWTGIGTFPVGSETGTWVVGVVVLYDNVGNNQEYSTSDLQALGFPTTLQVTSIQDTTPPVLTGFTFSPTAVNTTTNPATVSVTAQITDDLSGVREAYLGFNSPSGSQNVTVFLSLSSGTDLNGTWTGIGTFPVGSETGTWVVGVVVLYDNVGNNQEYSTSDLQALGFPTTLIVDYPTTTTTAVTSSSDPSVFGQTVTFTATVTPQGSGSPTGTVTFHDGSTTLGTSSLSSGTATFTISTLAIGTHSITAVYSGDSNFQGSSACQSGHNVDQRDQRQVRLRKTTARMQTITITAVLSWTGSGVAPTASAVTIGGNGPSGTYGTTSCGAPSGDTMTCTNTYTPTSADAPGNYTESATFAGDSNYSGSSSQQTNNFTINQATSSTSVASSLNPSTYGQAVTFTATISGENGLVKGRKPSGKKGAKTQDVSGSVHLEREHRLRHDSGDDGQSGNSDVHHLQPASGDRY
jgi:hypothetical protein